MTHPTPVSGRAGPVVWALAAIVAVAQTCAVAADTGSEPASADSPAPPVVVAGAAPVSGAAPGHAPTNRGQPVPIAITTPVSADKAQAAPALPPASGHAPPAPPAAPGQGFGALDRPGVAGAVAVTVPAPGTPGAADPISAVAPANAPAVIAPGETPPGDGGERMATETLNLLGGVLLPGTQARLDWAAGESFAGIAVPTPVLVTHGTRRGLTLCLTAAVHGDELNGVEIVRRVYYDLSPSMLSGTVIGVPIVNLPGFRRGSRYLPDRRDLNRYFPGSKHGSAAARIAHSFFSKVAGACDAVIDLHTGSLHRTNLPHVRADLNDPAAAALARAFANVPVLNDRAAPGTLRRAASHAGMAAVTFEAGSPLELQRQVVTQGVQAVRSALASLGMIRGAGRASPPRVFKASSWVRSESGGILLATVQPGDRVRTGQRLGNVVDPITNANVPVQSPVDGVVLGQALDQVVLPGFAAFHIAIEDAADLPPDPAAAPEQGAHESPDGPEVERPE